MSADDLNRQRIDALLRDVREQHDHALSVLTDTLVQLLGTRDEETRRQLEADLAAETQSRVDAAEDAAVARIAQVEANAAEKLAAARAAAAEKLAAARATAAADLERARAAAAADLERARADAAADVDRTRGDADARTAAIDAHVKKLERDHDAAIAQIKTDYDARVALLERDRDALAAEIESAKAAAATVITRDAAYPTRLDRLLDGLRAIDAGRTLTDVLEALAVHAAREAARVAILLVRADRLQGWRAIGFEAAGLRDAAAIDIDVREGGIVTRASRTGRRAATSDREAMPAAVATLSPPRFASLPADRLGVAVPIPVGGHVVAVLYADDLGDTASRAPNGWPEAIEILARHAARTLEALTASKAVTAARPASGIGAGAAQSRTASESPEDAARRYAKLLVSEIKLYHQPAVDAGRRAHDLAARLAPEIARARSLYEERIGPDVRARGDYFDQELVRTLADGNPTLLGAMRSSSAS